MTDWCHGATDGVHIYVHVIANASSDEICGVLNGRLKVKVTAQPERGKANTRVAELLSNFFDVSTHAINCEQGMTSPDKVFCILGVHAADCNRRLHAS